MRMSPMLVAAVALLLAVFSPSAMAQEETAQWLDIELGKSIVLETPRTPTAIAITDPEVANVVPLGIAQKIQVQGTAIGSTDLVIQFGAGHQPLIYEITVHRDLSDLIRRIDSIVEGEAPRVYPLRERIVVQGPVDDLDTLEQVALVARIYDPEFVNLMTVRGDHQVQLEVVFAEMSRTATRELGINVLWGTDSLMAGITSPTPNITTLVQHPQLTNSVTQLGLQGGIPAPVAGGFSLLGYVGQIDLGVVLGILDDYTVTNVLSQPTLVSLSGQEAQFLAGGEVPIPAPAGNGTISINFKEYGIILTFVPTVLSGNVIDCRVYMEVSEPDFAVSTRITGIEVPGFVTRKASSHMRIQSGMTFAMAGMLSDSTNFTRVSVPGLGAIPIIGALFRRINHSREETELMIFVTPRLVRPLAPGEVPVYPGQAENNNPGDLELYLFGMATRPGSRTAEPTANVGLKR